MPRPIIFFGSSLNPPHKAHLALVRYMIDQAKTQNPKPIIVLAPVYKHMFSKSDLADFAPRIHWTQTQFRSEIDNGDVVVSNIEELAYKDMQAKQGTSGQVSCGTVDILQFIKDHPEVIPDGDANHISLMLGADTYHDFVGGKWKEAERIIEICDTIHVFDRDGLTPADPQTVVTNARAVADEARKQKLDKIENKLNETDSTGFGKKFILRQGAITDPDIQRISSTNIRNDITHAIKGLVDDVLKLIRDEYHHLFKSTREEREKMSASTINPTTSFIGKRDQGGEGHHKPVPDPKRAKLD